MIGLLTICTPAWGQSLQVSTSSPSLTIHPGDQNVPLPVTVNSNGFSGPVTVTLTGLPSGIAVTPLVLNGGGSGVLTLSASTSADAEGLTPGLGAPDTHTSTVAVIAIAGSSQGTSGLSLTVSLENAAYAPAANQINLPIVSINTNGQPIVDKTTDVSGTITITSADGKTSYLPNSSDKDITATFHLHGNSTVLMPKKPYSVKLNTSLDLLNTMGLSCPYVTSGSGKATCDKSKSYILLANYDDKTLMRDWAASALANAIPIGNGYLDSPANSPSPSGTSVLMPWAPHSLFVEVYLNGAYQGNYQLSEEIKVDSHRVNITELDESDTSGDLTGGYLLEIDKEAGVETFLFNTPTGLPITVIDPDLDMPVAAQNSYISNYISTAESALFSANFTDPTLGWRPYFDEASAVNFYIVNDVMGNTDGGAFSASDYLYKDKDNPLLYMGPIWDFDLSSGNQVGDPIVNPTVPWMQAYASWYAQWFKDPGFSADVTTQWNALKKNGVLSTWVNSITQQGALLQQSQANNFSRWPMQGSIVWPNAEVAGSYNGEVSYLINWINLRIGYFDSLFNHKLQTFSALEIPSGAIRNGTASTFTIHVSGGSAPGGTATLLSNGVVVDAANLDSYGNATLTTSVLPIGTNTVQAVYNGDNTNGLSLSAPVPVVVSAPFVSTVTSLATSTTNARTETPVDLTILVVGTSLATVPTGTISFTANGEPLGVVNLSNGGTATFTTTDLPRGADTIQATYSGDASFSPSSSNSVVMRLYGTPTPTFSPAPGTYNAIQTVTLSDRVADASIYYTLDGSVPTTASTLYSGPIDVNGTQTINAIAVSNGHPASSVATAGYAIALPDFTLGVNPGFDVARSSQDSAFTLTVSPINGFSQPVSFACSGAPAGQSCNFSPATITPNGAPVMSTMALSTQTASLYSRSTRPLPRVMGGVLFALLLWPLRRRRKIGSILTLVMLGLFVLSVCGCGNSIRSSLITVTASSGNLTKTTTVILSMKN